MTRYIIPTWDCLDHWNGYFAIHTTWWNNNNGLKVKSHTKLKIIGPKVLSA